MNEPLSRRFHSHTVDDNRMRPPTVSTQAHLLATGDLIDLLASDAPPRWPLRRLYILALLGGILLGGMLLFGALGPRPDIDRAAGTLRFLLKFAFTLSLAAGAAGLTWTLARPASPSGPWRRLLLAAPGLAALSVTAELYALPRDDWAASLVGRNAAICLRMIPLLALGPLACLLLMLRRGAPSHPTRTGASAGLLAGAIGATCYAVHCPDDSPLFVVVWYGIGVLTTTLLGAIAGHRLLRW